MPRQSVLRCGACSLCALPAAPHAGLEAQAPQCFETRLQGGLDHVPFAGEATFKWPASYMFTYPIFEKLCHFGGMAWRRCFGLALGETQNLAPKGAQIFVNRPKACPKKRLQAIAPKWQGY